MIDVAICITPGHVLNRHIFYLYKLNAGSRHLYCVIIIIICIRPECQCAEPQRCKTLMKMTRDDVTGHQENKHNNYINFGFARHLASLVPRMLCCCHFTPLLG